jgi:DNA modification methylase
MKTEQRLAWRYEGRMNIIEFGDCRETMRKWASEGVKAQTCVTSPPYYGLRDYGRDGQIGLEETPEEYIAAMVEVFRCVRDVLAEDGTVWLNIGDSYAGSGKGPAGNLGKTHNERHLEHTVASGNVPVGCKPKDLIGIPWMLAFALRADGWYLRQDIIWHKPNPMPESVQDRCTKSHEYIFLLSKSQKYYYDAEAIKEPANSKSEGIRFGGSKYGDSDDPKHATKSGNVSKEYDKANKRSVWTVTTKPYEGAHFAVFPEELIEPCIMAGAPVGGVVLDPFMGSGTTAQVAQNLGRKYLGCELNTDYKQLQDKRLRQQALELI